MMSADDLDSIVKGAPALGRDAKSVGGLPPATGVLLKPGDPLNHTPSSPSMIYLNLLILEASLRAQFLELRARRRHHTFFLMLLAAWIGTFGWALFLRPREDGGVGGSIYWGVEVVEKVCLMGGVITAVLIWATGIFDRGIRWPRRWLAVSNRGLRGFNCKLVAITRPWWAELLSTIGFFLTYGIFHQNASSSYRPVDPTISHTADREINASMGEGHPVLPMVVEDEERGLHEEDLAPGGDYVKLLLLPKPFSATFRENWEIYRTEYWERENERRALIRVMLNEHNQQLAKSQSAWFWWLWLPWRGSPSEVEFLRATSEKLVHAHHLNVMKERKRRNSSVRRGSTSSSRSQTPSILDTEDMSLGRKVSSGGGSVGPSSDRRRKKVSSASVSGRPAKRPGQPESRSVTPDVPSPLARESSAAPSEARLFRSPFPGTRAVSSGKGRLRASSLLAGEDGYVVRPLE